MTLFSFFKKISKTGYLVALIALLTRIGYFMTLPFLAVYLTREGIFTPGQIGIVIGIAGLVFSISGLFNGTYIDQRSPRNILVMSFILSGFCYFGFAFSMKLFYALLCVNAALGWFRSLADISSISIIVANTEKENLSYAYSARFIAVNLGLVFGPLIGAVMANHHSLVIFYIAGIIHFAVGLALMFIGKQYLVKTTPQNSANWLQNLSALYQDKTLINIILINFLLWIAYSQLDSTVPQYITHHMPNPAILVSEIMVINAAICVLFQPVVSRWAELHSLKMSGGIGSVLFSAAFILIALFPSQLNFLIASGLLSVGELFTLPINSLLVMRIAPKHLVASYNGLSNFGLLGLSIGPIIGGYGLQFIGSKHLFLLIALLPIIVLWQYVLRVPD